MFPPCLSIPRACGLKSAFRSAWIRLSRIHAVGIGSAPAPGAAGRALAACIERNEEEPIRCVAVRSGSARERAELQPGRLCSPILLLHGSGLTRTPKLATKHTKRAKKDGLIGKMEWGGVFKTLVGHRSRRREEVDSRIPKGLRHSAQRLRGTSYPGSSTRCCIQP